MIFILKVITRKTLHILFNYSPLVLFKMALWPVYFILKRMSWLSLPEEGRDLGLSHVKSDYYSEFGMLKGRIQGCRVEVKPDEAFGARIHVNFRDQRTANLEFRVSRPRTRPDRSMRDFKTASWRFNLVFRTCRGSESVAERMGSDPGLPDLITAFYLRWLFDLEDFSINEHGIICEFNYGLPICAYLPARKMKNAVKELVFLADALEIIVA